MRTIIAGSRTFASYSYLAGVCDNHDISVVLSGTARGADQLGERWAQAMEIPIERYPAQWDLHGKSAGYKRNELMASKAEQLIAFWDGNSRGTKHMVDIAAARGLKVHIVQFGPLGD